MPSDHYYSVLEGDFDLNGNGKFGEFGPAAPPPTTGTGTGTGTTGDFGAGGIGANWSLAVGRIPVYGPGADAGSSTTVSTAQLDHVLGKLMRYESESVAELSKWRGAALVAAEGENRVYWGEAMARLHETGLPNHTHTYRVYDAAGCYTAPPDTAPHLCGATYNAFSEGVPLSSKPDALACTIANVAQGWRAVYAS